jgi:hypothetical protein
LENSSNFSATPSMEPNELPAVPRRRPRLTPDPPKPLEPAPPPRPVFRLRTWTPEPSEGPRKDSLREVFFTNWKARNPSGTIDSEDFERAYGDFQAKQLDAKKYYRKGAHVRLGTVIWRGVIISALVFFALKTCQPDAHQRAQAEVPGLKPAGQLR